MIKRIQLVFLFLLYVAGIHANNDLKFILNRMMDPSFDIQDEKRPVPSHSTNVDNLLKSLDKFNADGSYKTSLPTITEAEKNNAGGKWDSHRAYLNDVKNIAVLYGYNNYYPNTIASEYHGKLEYKELVYSTLKWYFANHRPPISVYHETFSYHAYSTTTTGLLGYIGMLLYDDFHVDRKTDSSIQNLFENIVSYCHHVITDNPQTRGPNWSFRYGNCMRHVLFSDSVAEMDTFIRVNDASIDFDVWAENGTDGVWPDWSLTHHGDMNYWGMYGTSWLGSTLDMAAIVKGTPWEYSDRAIQFIESSIVDGLQWILFHGNTEMTTAPKRLTYFLDRTDNAAEIITELKKLVQLHGDKLRDKEGMINIYNNIDPSWKSSSQTYNEVTGHKYFWNTEYQVHRRGNYSIAVRRCSQRVRGPEDSSNSDIKCHLHFGSGFTSILRRGDEYRLSRLGLDYQSLPGTTTERNGIVNAGKSGSTKRGINLFSGGVSEGGFGAGAFEMKLGEYNGDNGSVSLVNGAGALKGNFFFENEMLCLGQDVKRIKSGASEIWTTINQLQRRGEVVYCIDGGEQVSIALNEMVQKDLNVDSIAWFWHDEIGYVVRPDEPIIIKLLAERRTLNPILMEDNSYVNALSSEDKSKGTINMLHIAINHGVSPNDETYNYSVFPDMTVDDLKQQLNLNGTQVIQNSDKLQAVFNGVDKVLEAVFYEPGELILGDGKTVKVDKKAIVMLRQEGDSLFVSAANPVHRGLRPSYEISGSRTIGILYDTPINVILKGFGIKDAQNDYANVAIQLPVERAYEGQTKTKSFVVTENGGFNTFRLPFLNEIYINGELLADFSPSKFAYDVDLYIDSAKEVVVQAFTDSVNRMDYDKPETDIYQMKVTGLNGFANYTVCIHRKGRTLNQYTETFTNLINNGGFMTKSFVGDNDITWNISAAKYATYQGTGTGVYIRGGHVASQVLGTGIKDFSVTLYNKWNDDLDTVKTTLYINDQAVAELANNSKDTVYLFEVKDVNIEGNFSIKLKNTSATNTTLVIDNISWIPLINSDSVLEEVPVTGISLDKSNHALWVNETVNLSASITPDIASEKRMTWHSSNNAIATVHNGLVTGISRGEAIIEAISLDGQFAAQCLITVNDSIIDDVGIAGNDINYLKVFSPAKGILRIKNAKTGGRYRLYDLSGKNIQEGILTDESQSIRTHTHGILILSLVLKDRVENVCVVVK